MKNLEMRLWDPDRSTFNLIHKLTENKMTEETLRETVESRPDDIAAWEMLMLYYYYHQDIPRALEIFDQTPGESDVLYHIKGLCHDPQKGGNVELSIMYFRKALEINPLNIESRLSLATLLNRLDRHEEALSIWNQMVELDPHWSEAWTGRARCLLYMGDPARAVKSMNAAIFCLENGKAFVLTQQPKEKILSAYHSNRADCYLKLGLTQDALKDFLICHRFDPSYKHAVSSATRLLIKQDRLKEAVSISVAYLEKNPDDADWHTALMGLYGGVGNLAGINSEFAHIQRIVGSRLSSEYRLLYASSLINGRAYREALAVLEEILPGLPFGKHRRQCLSDILSAAYNLGDKKKLEYYQAMAKSEGLKITGITR